MAKKIISKKWALIEADLHSLARGFFDAAVGAGLLFIASWLLNWDLTPYFGDNAQLAAAIVGSLAAVIGKLGRKYSSETEYK